MLPQRTCHIFLSSLLPHHFSSFPSSHALIHKSCNTSKTVTNFNDQSQTFQYLSESHWLLGGIWRPCYRPIFSLPSLSISQQRGRNSVTKQWDEWMNLHTTQPRQDLNFCCSAGAETTCTIKCSDSGGKWEGVFLEMCSMHCNKRSFSLHLRCGHKSRSLKDTR